MWRKKRGHLSFITKSVPIQKGGPTYENRDFGIGGVGATVTGARKKTETTCIPQLPQTRGKPKDPSRKKDSF